MGGDAVVMDEIAVCDLGLICGVKECPIRTWRRSFYWILFWMKDL
ncbi:hypothetical protein [Methanolapillus africanus]